jgi:murein DD-endopeptidase MepM/ murein hydrolase activator NlpD
MTSPHGYDDGDYYDSFGGTSAAAPLVSGLAALILSVDSSLTPVEVENIIEQNAVDLGASGRDDDYGYGRINAYRALRVLIPHITNPTQSNPRYAGPSNNPQKILIEVEAWRGFEKDDFSVQIGEKPASILTAVPVGDKHFLEVIPPIQPSNGFYDLTITIGSQSDTEIDAIQFDVFDAGKLPWRCGDWIQVKQNRQSGNHRKTDEWAWDFGNSNVGWPIYAARDGIVAIVETGYPTESGCDSQSCWHTANRVVVDHGDGKAGLYLHLVQEVPPRLTVGDSVRAGVTVIGCADTTGWASGPHLHYAVQEWNSSWNGHPGEWYKWSMRSSFSDPNVPGGNPTTTGGPGSNGWYPSGNCPATDAAKLTLMLGSLLKNRTVTIELRRTSGFGQLLPPVFEGTGTTDGNGTITDFVLTGVAPDTYHLLVKPRSWLRRQESNVSLASGSNVLDLQALLNYCSGDINGNNKVEEIDWITLISDFLTTAPRSDLNGDGIVDEIDYAMLIVGFGKYGDGGEITPGSYGSSGATAGALQAQGRLTLSHAQADTFEVGQVLTLTLGFDPAGLPMAGTSAIIDYDHCVLEPLKDQITDSGIFSITYSISTTGVLEYGAYKGSNPDSSPVSGTGYLADIAFRIIAGVPTSTTVAIRFRPGSTFESNMVEDGTIEDFLGSVTNFVLHPTGTPQRPSRTAQVTNPLSGGTVNQNAVMLEAGADDPCNGIRQVTFYVFYDGQWHEVGTDTNGADGWAIYWDASPVSDQSIKVKAFASDMAGNGVETLTNDNILLDRQPPTVTNLVFEPTSALVGQLVTITVDLNDSLAGVKRADVYVDPSTDGSTPGHLWNLLGSVYGTTGSIIWDTTGYLVGSHQIVLVLEDMADNQIFWPLPGETPISYPISFVPMGNPIYLPLIFKHHVSGPDLVVDSLVATSDAVTVTIKNQGSTPVTDEFWVDVYFNPTETPSLNHPWDTITSHGVVWGVTTSIPPGSSLVLTTGGDYYFPEYSSPVPLPVGADVYALVDSINYDTTYGVVRESDEDNNLFGPVTSTASVAGEAPPVGHQGQPPSMEGLPPRR